MIGRALNSNNDLFVLGGKIATVEDGAEVVQHVRTRLLFFLGEWVFDITAGTPWFDEIFVKPANLANVESILKARILQTEGVNKLNEFEMNYEGGSSRQLTISFDAETDYGEINSGEVYINV